MSVLCLSSWHAPSRVPCLCFGAAVYRAALSHYIFFRSLQFTTHITIFTRSPSFSLFFELTISIFLLLSYTLNVFKTGNLRSCEQWNIILKAKKKNNSYIRIFLNSKVEPHQLIQDYPVGESLAGFSSHTAVTKSTHKGAVYRDSCLLANWLVNQGRAGAHRPTCEATYNMMRDLGNVLTFSRVEYITISFWSFGRFSLDWLGVAHAISFTSLSFAAYDVCCWQTSSGRCLRLYERILCFEMTSNRKNPFSAQPSTQEISSLNQTCNNIYDLILS
jgi:hypothetical protein